jgi:DNA repair protein RecN (Recombination protein N)
MLQHLHIKNIALIEDLSIDFAPGLNVLTGETGAGKSIIVDSMNLVLGERADRDLIKTGRESALVEAVFDTDKPEFSAVLAEYGFEGDDALIFSRELYASGKNICRVNGHLTTLSVLKELSDRLVDLHGQHEHQSLLDEKKHLSFLDKYAGDAIAPPLAETAAAYEAYRDVQKRLSGITGLEGERDRKLDILRFQIDEIERAKLNPAEEEELTAEREKMLNSEKITSALNTGYDTVYGGGEGHPVLSRLKHVIGEIDGIKALDTRYEKTLEKLNDIYYSLEEAAFEMRELKDEFYFDPERLEEIENRLHTVRTLKRKYGGSVEAALGFLDKAQREYNDLLDSENLIASLNEELKAREQKLKDASGRLSKKRRECAKRFEKDVMQQLKDLGLGNSVFEARFLEDPAQGYSRIGTDTVEFYISTNPGEPLKPLKKVVSGGEVSRIMLALKNISAGLEDIQCMIFDEIDTGISGAMAHVVGEKMLRIARARQVICVTHLAQIASLADRHFLITKQSDKGVTHTGLELLKEERRVKEIARLAGGSESAAAFSHAAEMLERAEKIKKTI